MNSIPCCAGTLRAVAIVFCLLLWPVSWGQAQDFPAKPYDPVAARAALEDIESRIFKGQPTDQEVGDAIGEAGTRRSRANQCATTAETNLARIASALQAATQPTAQSKPVTTEAPADGVAKNGNGKSKDSGGSSDSGSPPSTAEVTAPTAASEELARDIESMKAERAAAEARLAECRLLATRWDDLVARLTVLQQQMLKERLSQKERNVGAVLIESLRGLGKLLPGVRDVFLQQATLPSLGWSGASLVAACSLLGLGIGLWLRRKAREVLAKPGKDWFSSHAWRSILSALVRYLPIYLMVFGAALSLHGLLYKVSPPPYALLLLHYLFLYLSVQIVIRAILRPPEPGKQLTPLPDPLAHSMARRLSVLVFLMFLGYALFRALPADSLPESVMTIARAVVVTVICINLAWLTWLVGQIPDLRGGRGARFALLALLLWIVVAEWMGYRNLSAYLLSGLINTLVVGASAWMLSALLRDLLDGLDEGQRPWQLAVRKRLGLRGDEGIPGMIWLRFVLWVILWGGLILAILRIWGLSDAGTAIVMGYLVDGFNIGDTHIVPSKVLLGLLLFALLLTAARWLRDRLERQLQRRTRLDTGSRDAVVTISGYAGFGVAILVGMSLAGVNFANLAIVAGALSVGIGFGLQTIVNNFVSGIILLFERPIRPGDWIVVGSTEGLVKKVRVRATEIQTFDRSDVIVPNSELISGQVVNWTYRDPYGRVVCPVTVAYGTDIALVRKTLLEVAGKHPGVLSDGILPPPKALFRGFGDSALTFELRCFIRNVRERLDVQSDLLVAIDAAFRANGIEIPFPQRDVRVHLVDEKDREALRKALPDQPQPQ
ncbi:MAG: mechanosensitive ion channel family protein [Chromatiales bacterium]|nr:mechanosensitive ion channel family protein [Chromatiales bacterium]